MSCWGRSIVMLVVAASLRWVGLLAFAVQAASAVVLACPSGIVDLVVTGFGTIADMDRGLRSHRQDSRRQACPHAHRTPALYSRNQPRTTKLHRREKRGRGGITCRVALCELGMWTDKDLNASRLCC